MLEKAKRPKKLNNQDRQIPTNIQELINRYDLDNLGIYDFLDELILKMNDEIATSKLVNYSTEEQVVGKWIDGKPLYQRTIKYTSGWNIGYEVSLPHNISNLDKVVDFKAFYTRSDGTTQHIPNVHNDMALWGAGIYDFSVNNFTLYIGTLAGVFTINELFITLRYTKTTD